MNKFMFYISLIIAHFIYLAIKILNKSSGTSFIGMSVLKICSEFLKYCENYVKKSITVTGTNGKTTTSGLLAHILENSNSKILHNVKGANMLTGIANAFALNINPFSKFDYAVLELDEAYLTKLYDYYQADFLMVTNLFRDQLDRYGELATTAGFIRNAIEKNENLQLLLNADDPLVTNLGKGRNAKFFGFEEVEMAIANDTASNAPTEVFNCVCNSELKYTKQFMAQEGHYHCNNCGYSRPEPDFKGYVKILQNHSELKIIEKSTGKTYEFRINLVGLYNAYNALGAISQALILGIDYDTIKKAVLTYKSIFGRAEKRVINRKDTLIQLIKNPTGASEVLKTVDLSSNIVIAINDNYADGRDISWLWDSNFELLKDTKYPIIVSGIRAKDMATRLKYAGVDTKNIIIEEDIEIAIKNAVNGDGEIVTILPTYTALLKINKIKF